jgi:hypothetical protein
MQWTVSCLLLLATGLHAQGPKSEVRVGAALLSTDRTVFSSGLSEQSRGTLTAFEFLALGDGAGIGLRLYRGDFGGSLAGGDIRQAEASFLIGSPVFSFTAAYGRRARGTSLTSDFLGYGRAGLRSMLTLGASGFAVELAGAGLFSSVGQPEKAITSVGREGQVGLIYQLPRGIPLYGTLGYRYLWFKNHDRAGLTREETSSLILGVGVRHVRLPVPTG